MAGKRDKSVAAELPDTIESNRTAVVRLGGEPSRRNSLTVEQWAKRINARWQESVAGILGTAGDVYQAWKENEKDKKAWRALVGKLSFGAHQEDRRPSCSDGCGL
jgi:hypothetical protein